MPAVLLEDVTKRYPQGDGWVSALSQVNLAVDAGVIMGVIGFSGAGKSTLLRCISRLERPEQGRVIVDGSDLATLTGAELRVARRKLGVVFQQYKLLRSRTVFGNIALPLEIAGTDSRELQLRVEDLLRWVGLEDKAESYPTQLSGGQQQRAAIARALAAKPSVLLADEPTSALDPETTASVLTLLRRIRDELGLTILLITHELDAVRAICDRVAVLDGGTIVEEGSVLEVLTRPRSRAAERLLGKDVHLSELSAHLGEPARHAGSVFLELQFFGSAATDHILFDVARTSEATFSILQAHIVNLSRTGHGSMLVELTGAQEAMDQAQEQLRLRGANVTVVDPWHQAANLEGGHA